MKLQEGSYENIITNELRQDMLQAEGDGLVCKQENIDDAESPFMLAEHVNKIVLNRLSDENLSAEERMDFVNRLIDFLHEDKEEKVVDDKQMLSAVVQKSEEARLKATKQDIVNYIHETVDPNDFNNETTPLKIDRHLNKMYMYDLLEFNTPNYELTQEFIDLVEQGVE